MCNNFNQKDIIYINYKFIQIIKDAYFINGFIQINDNLFGSYGDLNIWRIKNKKNYYLKYF